MTSESLSLIIIIDYYSTNEITDKRILTKNDVIYCYDVSVRYRYAIQHVINIVWASIAMMDYCNDSI